MPLASLCMLANRSKKTHDVPVARPVPAASARSIREVGSAQAHRSVRMAHANELAEDYVEAIAQLARTHGEARVVELARWMGVSHVTVVRTIARLRREGLVDTKPYRALFLTPSGRRLAERARARHALVEAFLLALGVPPKHAKLDAEGIEHHVSAKTLAAMQRFVASRRAAVRVTPRP